MNNIITADEMAEFGRENDGYDKLLYNIMRSFQHAVENEHEPLFMTDAGNLYDIFLSELPEEAQQHYNCNACRSFVNRYGGLVRIKSDGKTESVMWGRNTAPFFRDSVDAMRYAVEAATVSGVFLTDQAVLGTPKTGSWSHMAVDVPVTHIFRERVKTTYQAAAEKTEDRRMLCEVLRKYKRETVAAALNLLNSNTMFGSEKVVGNAEWLLNVYDKIGSHKGKPRNNIIWSIAATAPTGYCHVSSSMLGTVLDDIKMGLSVDAIKAKFEDKMNPLQYQRPQAAPSAGNVAQAEKIVAKLGLENSLRRRYARLEELQTIWMPKPVQPAAAPTGGVFAGVKTKNKTNTVVMNEHLAPEVKMTWVKFRDTVLAQARKIEFMVGFHRDSYSAIVTAEDPAAPPIIQWDSEEQRNPFNWYVYHNGSEPGTWNLRTGWREVTGVALQPNMWQEGFEHQGKAVFFLLDGCYDRNAGSAGLALFPVHLKSDLHEVRSTIEAFSNRGAIYGYRDATACGIRLSEATKDRNYQFRVTTDTGITIYTLDRWD